MYLHMHVYTVGHTPMSMIEGNDHTSLCILDNPYKAV